MAFLRNLLASILGSLAAFGILFMMFLIFAALAGADQQARIRDHSILQIRLNRPVAEYTDTDPEDPFALLSEPSMGLNEITKAIRIAKEDDRIAGISLTGPFAMAGLSQTRAIRETLKEFRESGKFVYAYSDLYMQKDYYLSSMADSLFINPMGILDFKGLAAEILYFGDFQEQTGLKMEVVRHGKYKSAVEPFLSDEMSEENRRQVGELLQSIWTNMRSEIAESRELEEAQVDRIANELLGRSPDSALRYGLVDGVLYRDQYDQKLLRESGSDRDEAPVVDLEEYIKYSRGERVWEGSDRIAVIYGQGEILYGEGSPEYIGQGIMTKALKKAREDDRIKAVVLRINSPGGSGLTSEILWREIQLTREAKPVVVSISDVAASGGYYMAVAGDEILVEPTSITGSIGVFMTIPNVAELSEKVGINAEQVGTHDFAVDYSLFEPMREDFREVLQDYVAEGYETFLERVAEGRGISLVRADSLGQGRVWSGKQAVELGLADGFGGLPEALERAAERAGIDEYRIQELPRYKTGLERLLEDMGMTARAKGEVLVEETLGAEWAGWLRAWKEGSQREGIQARLPYSLKIR